MSNKCSLRLCNCYHEGTATCRHCTRNENPSKHNPTDNYITVLDKVNELYLYLQDKEIPDGIHVKPRPKLSQNKAWSLIWFLQEVTHCLPDHIERCGVCGDLYNSNAEGFCLDDQYELNGKELPKKYWGLYCDGCVPNVDFKMP